VGGVTSRSAAIQFRVKGQYRVAAKLGRKGPHIVGVGVLLAVIGAILTFAVRANTSVINLPVVGIILMVAGGALIWHGSKGTHRKKIVTREERPGGATFPTSTVRQTIEERDVD
jgi:hypothetical protein